MVKRGVRAGVMLGAYNALYRAAYSGVYPAVRTGIVGTDWRWDERMGRYPALDNATGARVWVHAASVGEAKSAAVLVAALFDRLPDLRLVVSTVTPAGWKTAREAIPHAETVVQAPIDLRGPVKRALSWFDPSLFIIVETEIWPNMILECSRRGTPVAMASAKISRKSYGRYRYIRPLIRYVLSAVSCVAAQTEVDRDRLYELGLERSKALVTGDLKLDARTKPDESAAPAWLSQVMGSRFLFVAGSTRPEEEEIIGRALLKIEGDVFSIIAPRHISRCGAVAGRLSGMGLDVALKSTLESEGWGSGARPRVLVLDTIGELAGVYRECDFAFVGGTLAPYGGHNLAEPASCGVPVLFGPSFESVRTVAGALIEFGGGIQVTNEDTLAVAIRGLLLDPSERGRRGEAASKTIASLGGAAGRTLDFFDGAGILREAR